MNMNQKNWTLTLYYGLAVRAIIADLLNVTEVDVAVEDPVGSLSTAASVVEGKGDYVLHVLWIFEGFNGSIEVCFIRQVDALQYRALRVEEVAIIVPATVAIFCQHAMCAGTGTIAITTEQTQLFTTTIVHLTDVGTCKQ